MRGLFTTLRRHQEPIGRWTGFALFAVMVARQLTLWPGLGAFGVEHLRWALITLLFVLFWSAYWRRARARALASRPVEIVLPLVCAGLPLAQYPPEAVLTSFGAWSPAAMTWLMQPLFGLNPLLGLAGMALGEAITVAGMVTLGRSFSIFSEARELRTTGLYRWVRHPLYLGEMLTVWCYVLAWAAPWSLGCAVVFTALQSWRARVEERLLLSKLPGYAEYHARTGFLLPRLSALGNAARGSRRAPP